MTRSFRPLFPRLHLLLCVCLAVQGQIMAMGGVWPEGQDTGAASDRRLDGAKRNPTFVSPRRFAPLLLICDASHRWIRMSDCASLHPTYGLIPPTLASVNLDAVTEQQMADFFDFNLDLEELDMLFFALPDAVPQVVYQAPVVMVADASASSSKTAVRKMTYGVCELAYAYDDKEYDNAVDRDRSINSLGAGSYLIEFLPPEIQEAFSYPHSTLMGDELDRYEEWNNAPKKYTLLRAPKHGKFVDVDAEDGPYNYYLPDRNYVGKDRVDLLVEGKDYEGRPISMTLRYYINVLPREELDKMVEDESYYQVIKKYCGAKNGDWRISESQPDDSSPLALLSGAFADSANWYQTPSLQALLMGAKDALTGFTDLSGAALGQTTGDKITLDTDAAGHTWFFDYTPYLNEEWLPTSSPYEWKAKPGSEAEGKMDLLSVLLHEYGHVLGIEHSADQHDAMAATLQPGVRRLPNVEAWLTLQNGITGLADNTPAITGTASPQYAIAANPTLTNADFTSATGWQTTGNVGFASKRRVR